MNSIDLDGRVAVVTGGLGDMGRAIAARFLASGATVELWDRTVARADEIRNRLTAGSAAVPLAIRQVDVTDLSGIEAAVAACVAEHERIDIFVNNAGIAGPVSPTWTYDPAAWRQVIEIDLIAHFLCARSVVPTMLRQDYGRVINISSIAGKEGNANDGAYSAARGGVIAFTKSLGKELAKTGIRVNCVTPAVFDTEILKQQTPEHIDYVLSKVPIGRFGQPPELAALVAWLASEDCSFSTGAVFDISGGRATY